MLSSAALPLPLPLFKNNKLIFKGCGQLSRWTFASKGFHTKNIPSLNTKLNNKNCLNKKPFSSFNYSFTFFTKPKTNYPSFLSRSFSSTSNNDKNKDKDNNDNTSTAAEGKDQGEDEDQNENDDAPAEDGKPKNSVPNISERIDYDSLQLEEDTTQSILLDKSSYLRLAHSVLYPQTLKLNNFNLLLWGQHTLFSHNDLDLEDDCLSPILLPLPDESKTSPIDIALGPRHIAVINADGELYIAGWNDASQLGFPTDDPVTQRYRKVEGIPKIKSVACGRYHTLALSTRGEVWSWGCFAHGHGHRGISAEPQKLNIDNVVEIAAGYRSSVLRTQEGFVYSIGSFGSAKPQIVEPFTGVQKIAANDQAAGLISDKGEIHLFGLHLQQRFPSSNRSYESNQFWFKKKNFGNKPQAIPTVYADPNNPNAELTLPPFINLAVSDIASLAIDKSGRLWELYGGKMEMVLGEENSFLPVMASSVATSLGSHFVVDTDGYLHSYGDGSSSCLGNGSIADVKHPTKVKGFGPLSDSSFDVSLGRARKVVTGYGRVAVLAEKNIIRKNQAPLDIPVKPKTLDKK